jgi:hypothetical protein
MRCKVHDIHFSRDEVHNCAHFESRHVVTENVNTKMHRTLPIFEIVYP